MIKAVVVEDSRLAREGLVRMLEQFAGIAVVGQADHPDTALILIERARPDVIFLDIHMPGATGFDLLEKLDYTPRVVFTTAHCEYAIRSFDHHTIDYLLKPISQDRLAIAIGKLKQDHEGGGPVPTGPAPVPVLDIGSRMFVKDADKCHLVTLESIRYVESCRNYVRIFFGDQKAFVKKSLSGIEERLPRKHFFRVSRQHIVNLQSIDRIDEAVGDGYVITMSDGKEIEVSRRNAAELKEMLSF